jgi:signal transduction histidine kinase
LVDAVMRVLRHETDVVAYRTPINGAGVHQPPRSSSSIEATGSQQAQVLVVDDQRENVRLLMNVLRQEGYVVRSAYDGHAALRSAQAMPPDLILLDVRMPEMDGYELCERIKGIPRLRSVPVIFISVADGTLDKVRAFALGAVDYITKPFELAELRMRIASHLAIHRLAASEERQRIARELHDAVSQTLFSAKIVAESLPILLDKDTNAVRAGLVDLIRLTQAASAEMRSLLMELRPNTLTHTDLNILLTYLVNGASGRTTASINLQTKGQEPILPFNVKINLYRIAQEALNNIIKHSQAKYVTLTLTCDRESPDTSPNSALLVVLQVRDDGCGFLPDRVTDEHMGLRIMRERAAEANISLEIKTAVNQGTIVEAAWGAFSQ